MAITKEEVVAKATSLGLTLTEEQINQHVTDQKLPEKEKQKDGTTVEELVAKYSPQQLAVMLQETRSEAAERRRENKTLKEQAEAVAKQIEELQKVKGQLPEFEAKMKDLGEQLKGVKESEKKRREAAIAKLDEKKKATFSYLGDVDKISADQFDATIDSLVDKMSDGTGSQSPAGSPPGAATLQDKLAEAQKNKRPLVEIVALQRQIAEAQKA